MLSRHAGFTSHAPFVQNSGSHHGLASLPHHISGPSTGLNPTSAHYLHEESPKTGHRLGFHWTSRNNRKGRHALVLSPSANAAPDVTTPKPSSDPFVILHGIWRMIVKYPVGDISWWVAYIFVWGSVVWILNAMFVFLPSIRPSSEFGTEILYGGGITAFIGATIFEVGSFLLMLEAINEEKSGCFGWAVDEALVKSHSSGPRFSIKPMQDCKHTHHEIPDADSLTSVPEKLGTQGHSEKQDAPRWNWWVSWYELRTHYLREIGFLACLFQFFGASVFWIAGLTALPGIQNRLSTNLAIGIYWTPQVVGGSGFIVSGVLFMVETQTAWYKPNLYALGWHIGIWNLIGGIGFTLSGGFGYSLHSWALYQSGCSTFWGSFAFLIGSVLQWYESLEKHPVQVATHDELD